MYEITIRKITVTEYPETDYRWVKKDTKEPCDYDSRDSEKEYFKTGKMLKREDSEELYTQRLDELDVKKLAVFLNQSI